MASRYILSLAPLLALASATSYNLDTTYDATNFFTDFTFFAAADPTHGLVSYKSQEAGKRLGLTNIVDHDQVYIGVDNSTTARNSSMMPSVRLQSQKTYSKMLLVADIEHMPFACGAWPSLWTFADPWPSMGEIDIIEGVNSQSTNSMTLHTSDTCVMTAGSDTSGFTASSSGDCSAGGGTAGCQQQASDASPANYGQGFNAGGGGVYAMEWTSAAISFWFFARGAVPDGLSAAAGPAVDASALGPPLAQFVGGEGCSIDERFAQHAITIDTTFCGDWAGEVWSSDETCSAKASSCEAFMASADPSEFEEAYWLFNSIKVYTAAGNGTAYT